MVTMLYFLITDIMIHLRILHGCRKQEIVAADQEQLSSLNEAIDEQR